MALGFATIESRAGAAIRARFRNATATPVAGGVAVEGHYASAAAEAGVGSRGMVGRELSFVCATADAAGFTLGALVDIAYQAVTTRWRIDTRTDDVHLGDTVLTLRKP